jgi:hypothetical protein
MDGPIEGKEAVKVDEDDDLVRGEAPGSKRTSDQQMRKNVSYEIQQPLDLGAQSDSVASGRFGQQPVPEGGNVFKDGE